MQRIVLETSIAAPPARCFLLSLNIDLHVASTEGTSEQAIDGVTHGLIGPGETVTWRGRHFGLMLTHKTLISHYERPRYFQDVMLDGAFQRFEHDHYFEVQPDGGTLMRDELVFKASFGPLGRLAETVVLSGYLRRFLIRRNALIKQVAESTDGWKKHVHGDGR